MRVFNKQKAILLFGIAIICICVGSIYDYQISCLLFHVDTTFGKIFAAYGQLPTTLGSAMIGFLLFYVTERKMKVTTCLAYLGAIFSYVMATMMAISEPIMYLDLPVIIGGILGVLEIIGVSYLTYLLTRHVDRHMLKKFLAFLAFVIYGQMLIINVLKMMAARPRMRMIAVTPEAHFQAWWEFGTTMKDQLMTTLSIASEEFKSFPSGHAGCSAVAMVYCVIPCLLKKSNGNIIFYLGLAFTLVVMVSRIIMGAHFLTDVAFGFTVTAMLIFIGNDIFFGGEHI